MSNWIYVAIVGAAIIGYANLRAKREEADEPAVDMESALEHFSLELEESNEQLMQTVSAFKRDLEAGMNRLDGRIEALEKQLETLRDPFLRPVPAPVDAQEQMQLQDDAPQEAELPISSRYPELLELYMKGETISSIAKKLGMNNGEVQLIIQLAKQEEQFRDEG